MVLDSRGFSVYLFFGIRILRRFVWMAPNNSSSLLVISGDAIKLLRSNNSFSQHTAISTLKKSDYGRLSFLCTISKHHHAHLHIFLSINNASCSTNLWMLLCGSLATVESIMLTLLRTARTNLRKHRMESDWLYRAELSADLIYNKIFVEAKFYIVNHTGAKFLLIRK